MSVTDCTPSFWQDMRGCSIYSSGPALRGCKLVLLSWVWQISVSLLLAHTIRTLPAQEGVEVSAGYICWWWAHEIQRGSVSRGQSQEPGGGQAMGNGWSISLLKVGNIHSGWPPSFYSLKSKVCIGDCQSEISTCLYPSEGKVEHWVTFSPREHSWRSWVKGWIIPVSAIWLRSIKFQTGSFLLDTLPSPIGNSVCTRICCTL